MVRIKPSSLTLAAELDSNQKVYFKAGDYLQKPGSSRAVFDKLNFSGN